MRHAGLIDFEPFLKYWASHRGASDDTIRAYRSDLKLFASFLADRSVTRLKQIDHDLIHEYINHMKTVAIGRSGDPGLSEATIARRLAAVSSFGVYMKATTNLKFSNPLEDFKRRWSRNNKPKPADEQELTKLLVTISSERDRVLIVLSLASGLRVTELQGLNRDTIKYQRVIEVVDGESKELFLGVGEVVGKGGKRRTFLVDKVALATCIRYQKKRQDENPALFISERGQRMSVRAMQERLQYWCKQAGIAHINIHRLRHTYATRLVNAGLDIMKLQSLLGHASLATTQNYAKLEDTTLARGYHAAMEWVTK